MASKFRSIVSKIFKRRPKPPRALTRPRKSKETLGGGHRGIAAGRLAKPNLSAENVAKWRNLSAGTVEDFVYDQQPLFVHSTNVEMAQYFLDTQQMLVKYLQDGTYIYDSVTEDEAIQFAKAQSKGGWVWNYLRVRGSKTQHKKPYRKVNAGYKPPASHGTPSSTEADEFFRRFE